MNGKRDYYEVLGVSRDADQEAVKQAYRNLARQYHPDVAENKHEAEEKFKEINEAFAVLSNPEKRTQYDRFGHAGVDVSSFGDFGFNFSVGFDVLDDLMEAFFGGTSARRTQSMRGRDLRYDLELTLEEAYHGIAKDLTIKANTACTDCKGSGAKAGGLQNCPRCHGAGQVQEIQQSLFGRLVRTTLCPQCQGQGHILKDPCKSCRGSGVLESQRKITLEIPAGVDEGNQIRLAREGEAGIRGGPPGDLYIFIHIKPHPQFRRQTLDILYNLEISFPEATLGNEIQVPTLSGDEKIYIPAGTRNGTTLRLRGKGMPAFNSRAKGDQVVVVSVQVPKKLNEKQKQLLQEFARISGIKLGNEKGLLGRFKRLTFMTLYPWIYAL